MFGCTGRSSGFSRAFLRRHGLLHPVPRRVFEIGAGTGYWTPLWLGLGVEQVDGCDLAPEAVARLRDVFPATTTSAISRRKESSRRTPRTTWSRFSTCCFTSWTKTASRPRRVTWRPPSVRVVTCFSSSLRCFSRRQSVRSSPVPARWLGSLLATGTCSRRPDWSSSPRRQARRWRTTRLSMGSRASAASYGRGVQPSGMRSVAPGARMSWAACSGWRMVRSCAQA